MCWFGPWQATAAWWLVHGMLHLSEYIVLLGGIVDCRA